MYVTPQRTYDFNKLASVTKIIVRNLNKIIDINYYPVPEVCLLLRCYFLSHTHTHSPVVGFIWHLTFTG